jgi:hypothetical protein
MSLHFDLLEDRRRARERARLRRSCGAWLLNAAGCSLLFAAECGLIAFIFYGFFQP